MAKCDDLGRIYGVQWRQWNTNKIVIKNEMLTDEYKQLDQLQNLIDRAKKDPLDRRLIVTAWRPDELNQMALPPCHYAWQILSDGTYLDLIWIQRSVDSFLGLPYNIASYGLLLLLLAWELKLKPRRLVGQLADTHLYVNHMEQAKTQLSREPFSLPDVYMMQDDWDGILNWDHTKLKISNYNSHSKIEAPIAV
jgi:thymidylate synthase